MIGEILDFFLGKKVDSGLKIGDIVTLNNPANEVSFGSQRQTILYYHKYKVTKISRNGNISVSDTKGRLMPKTYPYYDYNKILN